MDYGSNSRHCGQLKYVVRKKLGSSQFMFPVVLLVLSLYAHPMHTARLPCYVHVERALYTL